MPGKNLRVWLMERSLAGLKWLAARSSTPATKPAHLVTGERGEEAALFHLMRKGFTVVAQRWSDGPAPGDLDLIAWKDDVLCFVEVKTRIRKEVGTASAAVDRHKRNNLRRLARQYMRQLPESEDAEAQPDSRFDIVTVYELPGRPPVIQLIPGAFGWSERDQ